MKILVISDWHGNEENISPLKEAIKTLEPDLITFAGDILNGNIRRQEALSLYRTFYKCTGETEAPFVFIPGNLDAPLQQYMQVFNAVSKRYKNLNQVHNSFIPLKEDYVLAGFGGEITEGERDDISLIKFARWQFEFGLGFLKHFPKKKILLFHTPPISNLDLDGQDHKGSQIVNEMIDSVQPDYVICGHAHKAGGAQQIGRALVINPGALKDGNYAILDTLAAKVEFKKI